LYETAVLGGEEAFSKTKFALDNAVVGQQFLLNFDLFWKIYIPLSSVLNPDSLPLETNVYPVPLTAALPHKKPPSAGHPVRAALLRTAIEDSVLPCDPVNTSRYVVWWLWCFTVKWNDRKDS
jgi:hypothetical protein